MTKELKPLFVKVGEQQPVTETMEEKSYIDDKKYVLLYYATVDRGEDIKSFEEITGRLNVYEFIKGMIDSIDIHESKILVETVPFDKAATVYEFMRFVQSTGVVEDGFDIEDYNIGDM